MQKITPCLWFDTEAEEAARLYASVFKNSKITQMSRYGEAGPRPAGMVLSVIFELEGQQFMALNGGPEFPQTPAISFMVGCKDQEEIDYFWDKLSKGGNPGQCGWLQDRFGISWQIVPDALGELISDPDPEKSTRTMRAMLKMNKIDIKALEDARDNRNTE